MKYKFKVGDKVRVRPGVDLEGLDIGGDGTLRTKVQTITNATPGHERWDKAGHEDIDGTPTYSVGRIGWRIPEAFLVLAEPTEPKPVSRFKVGDKVRVIFVPLPGLIGKEAIVTQIGGTTKNSGVVITNESFPRGDKSYGEHGLWFPDDWLELV